MSRLKNKSLVSVRVSRLTLTLTLTHITVCSSICYYGCVRV